MAENKEMYIYNINYAREISEDIERITVSGHELILYVYQLFVY